MPRGGPRPNAGRKRGGKNPATYTKESAREVLRRIVLAEMRDLVVAQVANAKGLRYLVTRDSHSGKFVRVTAATLAGLEGQAARDDVIEVWEKEPSVAAFADLMNRAIDKPKEQAQEVEHTGGFVIRHELSVPAEGPALPVVPAALRLAAGPGDAEPGEGE